MIQKGVETGIQEQRFRKVYDQVSRGMEELEIPGGILGILHEGKEQIVGLGVTNIEHPLPVTPDTLFQAGSITKTFTATAVMCLVEKGLIELDEPILAYLPDLRLSDRETTRRVSMRHLLIHTGGWQGDFFEDFGRGEDALEKAIPRLFYLPQITPLGEVWSYNNSAYYLAGRIIEVMTGKSYEQAIQDLVLKPLGLKNSYFFAEEVITHRFTVGHAYGESGHRVARPWNLGRVMHPTGGLSSNAPDLLRYARFHMGDGSGEEGKRILSPESLRQMQTPTIPATGIEMMGLSWFVTEVNSQRIIEHPGGTNGQVSSLMLAPDKGYAMVLAFNSDRGRRLVERLKFMALEEFTGIHVPEATPVESAPQELEEYSGRYKAVGQILDLKPSGNYLELKMTLTGGFPTPDAPPRPSPPPALLGFYEDDRVVVINPPFKGERAEFVRDSRGQVRWMRLLGRLHTKSKGYL
jgi:CubicO group peptidase (beta-lactamase class C family)